MGGSPFESRGKSISPADDYAVKAKVNQDDVPERDTNDMKEGQLVTNVVIGEDSGFQILSSKDEEAEREKPKKVISTKVHKKKQRPPQQPSVNQHEHHAKDDLSQSLEKAKKLLDVKAAIEKLRLRGSSQAPLESEDGTASEVSTSSSVTSSSSSSDSDIAHIAPVTVVPSSAAAPIKSASGGSDLCKPLKPVKPAQQPHHPQVTSSADEFVWIDSYNRLVELQKLPWTHTDLCKAICQRTSMMENEVIGNDLLSRLSYYLQRALVRVAREAQRLAKSVGKCGKQEISSALKVVLSPSCKFYLVLVF